MKDSHQLPFKDFPKGISSFHLRWGVFSEVPIALPPDCGGDTTWSGEGCHHLVPEEGLCATGVAAVETMGVDFSLVECTWGEYSEEWPEICSL